MAVAEAEREDEEDWDADEALARSCRIVEALLFASVQPLSGEDDVILGNSAGAFLLFTEEALTSQRRVD